MEVTLVCQAVRTKSHRHAFLRCSLHINGIHPPSLSSLTTRDAFMLFTRSATKKENVMGQKALEVTSSFIASWSKSAYLWINCKCTRQWSWLRNDFYLFFHSNIFSVIYFDIIIYFNVHVVIYFCDGKAAFTDMLICCSVFLMYYWLSILMSNNNKLIIIGIIINVENICCCLIFFVDILWNVFYINLLQH